MNQVTSDHSPGVVVVITGELTRYAQFGQCLNRLRVPVGSDLVWTAGASLSRNIDHSLRKVLSAKQAQWAWMIGDDHTFHPDTVLDLLDCNVDCVVPVCSIRMPPFPICLMREGKGVPLEALPSNGLYKLTGDETYGDAGMLLRRNVIEATGPPWQEGAQSGTWTVEDRIFVEKIRAKGFDVHIDMDTAIGHITPCEILPEKRNGKWHVSLRFAKRAYNP